MQVVWLKRDLRLADHQPLAEAAARGPALLMYIYEPEILASAEFDSSHLTFINQSLAELRGAVRQRGGDLVLRHGGVVEILSELHRRQPITALYSHEETGNGLTYERDKRVKRWVRANNIPWHEYPQTGVIRPLRSRDGWAAMWASRMNLPALHAPPSLSAIPEIEPGAILDHRDLNLPPTGKPDAQRGGSTPAVETLESFLHQRGVNYRADMSSPVAGWDGCSRISPYLTWGCLSMRQAYQAAQQRVAQLKGESGKDSRWLPSLSSFLGRLRWHCHFMQKLEDEPRIEFENLHRACDGLRENEFDSERFQAWCEGRTGYPMVDACMRCVKQTGWLNFRMRAMLVSFASYHLWLHWRPTAVFLARHFLDFEPGIHFSQFQMQSGTTGINTIRIYSPAKQALDQDPQGAFIRRWAPELAGVPLEWLAEPHRMPVLAQQMAGCTIGHDYPAPIVDAKRAVESAKARIYGLRRSGAARAEVGPILRKHGSRKRPRWA